MRPLTQIFISVLLFFSASFSLASEKLSNYWSYDLHDLYSKKVDNTGEGYAPLSDLRNFRVVLYGVLYRSGANNVYNKKNKRNNENPIQNEGLKNLCQQNFSKAFYLYKNNFETAQTSVSCQNEKKKENTLQYIQLSALTEKNEKHFLNEIRKAIDSPGRPVLVHCWNGWHASGLISTLALKQFCGFNSDEALEYWIKNTDGNSKGYEKIKNRIRKFKPYPDLEVSHTTQKQICPVIGSALN